MARVRYDQYRLVALPVVLGGASGSQLAATFGQNYSIHLVGTSMEDNADDSKGNRSAKEPRLVSSYDKVMAVMNFRYVAFKDEIKKEGQDKPGLFARFRKQPDLMMLAMMVKGYEVAMSNLEIRSDESGAFEILENGITEFERQVNSPAPSDMDNIVRLGMLKGYVFASLDFHRALLQICGANYSLANNGRAKLQAILKRWDLQ